MTTRGPAFEYIGPSPRNRIFASVEEDKPTYAAASGARNFVVDVNAIAFLRVLNCTGASIGILRQIVDKIPELKIRNSGISGIGSGLWQSMSGKIRIIQAKLRITTSGSPGMSGRIIRIEVRISAHVRYVLAATSDCYVWLVRPATFWPLRATSDCLWLLRPAATSRLLSSLGGR